jgi:hypothetical protein
MSRSSVLNIPLIDGLVTTILALSTEEQQLLLQRIQDAHTRNKIEKRIKAFEEQYGMTSAVFHAQFLTGNLGDSEDYIEWAGFYEMLYSI